MKEHNYDKRLNELIEAITAMARMDFSRKLEVNSAEDLLDVVSLGFNMLSEALEDTVVSKSRLEESEQKYRLLFSKSRDANLVFKDAVLAECNEKVGEFFQTETKDMIGLTLGEFIKTYHAPGFNSHVYFKATEKMVLTNRGARLQLTYKRADDSLFHAESDLNVFNLDGSIIMQASIRDITEKKKNEDDLKYNMERFKTLFEHAPNALIITNGKRFLRVNPAFTELFGYENSELENLSLKDLTYFEDYDKHRPFEQKLLRGEIQKFRVEKRYVKKDRSIFFGEVNLSLTWQESGDPLYIVQIVDIDERKKADDLVKKHVQKLERTNRELDQFAYVVSHDLKAPLRGISTLASFIEEDIDSGNMEEVAENLAYLKNRIKRLDGLINGILEYSRVGRKDGQRELTDMNLFVREIIELIAPTEKTEIIFKSDLPFIWSTKIGITQIFQNIIGNAVKYNDKDLCRIEISCRDKGNFHEFTITDNGPGIPKEYHEKVFNIFQTLQPRDQIESTGVGLSIVKKQIETLGGTIRIQSEPEKGTSFIFTILKAENPAV